MNVTTPAETIVQAFRPFPLVYCDYICARIRESLKSDDGHIVGSVGHVQSDLHPVGGYLLSLNKTIEVTDKNGRGYRVTVEEVDPR